MSNFVYLVKSGRFEESVGYTEWLNLRAFTTYEAAENFIKGVIEADESFDEERDFLEIETLTLEQ
jgi:hypothetical protein